MLVTHNDLVGLRKKVAMVDGGFDPLHLGHIEYFKAACGLGLPLLCCIASDKYISTKHKPLLPQQYRAGVLDAIRYIDYVCINESTTAEVLEQLQPRYYVKGKDWENRLPPAETAVCAEYGIEVVYLDTVLDSSSRILKEYLKPKG
jgi:cytidyltransferase-like protein